MGEHREIPELRLNRASVKYVNRFDDREEIEFWKQTSIRERLQNIERLRRINYGVRATERLQRVIRIIKYE